MFIDTISHPHGEKQKLFVTVQEDRYKDVERAFSVLQKKFAIVDSHARYHKVHVMQLVIKCCMLLHNMVIEKNGVSCHIT